MTNNDFAKDKQVERRNKVSPAVNKHSTLLPTASIASCLQHQ